MLWAMTRLWMLFASANAVVPIALSPYNENCGTRMRESEIWGAIKTPGAF